MDLTNKIRTTIDKYFAGFANEDPQAVIALYAAGATVEDPVGTPPLRTPEAIAELYTRSIGSLKAKLKPLGDPRIAGNAAAFPFVAVVNAPDHVMEIEVIDIMTFNDDGKITSMRAYFGPDNTKTKAR